MPNRKNRARRRQGGIGRLLSSLIILFAIVAVALVFALIHSDPLSANSDVEEEHGYDSSELQYDEKSKVTNAPLVLGTSTESSLEAEKKGVEQQEIEKEEKTAEEEETITEENLQKENSDNRLIPEVEEGDYFLPVFDHALRTPDDRAMIAVTIDDCDDADVMVEILNIARKYDAELTLFPTGDALMRMASGFRACVNSLNYEIENCTYDANRRDYTMSSGELALQIWRQSVAASYAMSRDYQQHFYRPERMESVWDQRTHFFIRKLGFLGVAGYTHSYKDHDLEYLLDSLENGNIYQFDMSEKSMALFESFVDEASRRGYKLATMNELFGLEKNEVSDTLTIDRQTLPSMDDYVPTYYDLKLNYRTNAIYALQLRLMDLGYLVGEDGQSMRADGIYGAETSVAVSAFQAKIGLVATGNADVETQQRLFSEDAPMADS